MFLNRVLLLASCLSFIGCSSIPDNVAGSWRYSFETFKSALFGYEDFPITRELIDNIPYASIRLKIGKGPAGLLILEIKERKKNTWLSADQVTIVEREGKIIRTLGLTNNLTSIRPQSVNHVELVKNKDSPIYKSFISLDNPEVFELELKVKVLNKGLEEIEIVDKKYSLIHFIEEKENRYLRWKSKDHYWVDPEDGFVWKSIQNIAPNIPPIV
ncbi:uncharacterized protein METZ01_LOCUS372349, partial [marine metagenome]